MYSPSRTLFTVLVILSLASAARAQMTWSSYDTSGNLVTANVATGGDLATGGSVTFTIPANTQLSFVTKSFTPFSLEGASSKKSVSFQMSASGGLSAAASGVRVIGFGCYNSAGTASFADDVGYFGLLNAGNYTEPYYHSAGNANLFTGTKPGQGTTTTGFPADNVIYTNRLQLNMNASATGISLGTGNSATGAGVLITGPSVTQYSYINPVTPLVGGVSTFDLFAFMFNNTTASPITVTLSGLSLGRSLTWDASGTSPAAPTDGSGNWSSTNANWSSGDSDAPWSPNYSAVIGSTNGAAGTITISEPAGVTVSNITFRPTGSGSYSVAGSPLALTSQATITVAGAGTSATISSLIAGNGYTKEGAGTLILGQAANNTYAGDTIINNGLLIPGGTAGRQYVPGSLIVNTNGTFNAVSGGPGSGVFGSSTLILNGQHPNGSNVFVNSGAWITAPVGVLANGGVITNGGGSVSGTYAVTNTDARSGAVWLTRHGFGVVNNIYKSTPGSVIIATRPNSSANDGYVATLNAGALIFDYAYTANTATRLKANSPLTFAGGALVFSNSAAINPSTINPGTGGTFFNSGSSSLFYTNAGGGGGITLGAVTRKVGATFNLVRPGGTANIGSTTANVNGIVGGWNTYDRTDWTTGTSTWTNLLAASYQSATDPTLWGAADNVTLSGNPSANVGDGTNINSLRLTAAATVTLDGTLTLTSGGLLITGGGATAITGGTLRGASAADLIVHQYASADLTLSSTLADNGAATSLTKDGVGKLIITGTVGMTGTNFLNGGVVEVSDLSKLASGPLDMNGGTLRYTGSDTSSSRAVTTRGLGPTFDIVGGTTVTQSGAVVGSGDQFGDFGGLTKIGSGTLVLTASNYFNGETVISNGVLAVNGTNNFNPAVWDAGRVTIYGGTLGGTGMISGPVTLKGGSTIAPGTSVGTLTLATNLTLEPGSTNLFEVQNSSSGDLLQVQGDLIIGPNCTLAISVLGAPLNPATNVLITYSGKKSGSFASVLLRSGSLNSSLTIDESTPGQIKLAAIPQVAITTQPQGAIVSTNDPVNFSVVATGSAPLNYQWYFTPEVNTPYSPLTDATNALYSIGSADGTNNGLYQVVVNNSFNSVTSSVAVLIVGNVKPQLSGPFNQTVIQGNNATFSATVVIANPAPTFQWQTNGVDVPGATGTSLTFNNVQYALNNTAVSLIASNAGGIVTNSATLTVIVTPVITPQPTNITVNAGDAVSFVSGATGVPTPALQWYRTTSPSIIGTALSGQNSGTLSFGSAQGTNVAYYYLVATNTAGMATSSIVKLTVNSTTLAVAGGGLSPANGATGICYDTPLYLTFNGPISIVNSGKIRIFNTNNPATPVDTIDMGSNTVVVSTVTAGVFLTNNIQAHTLFPGDSQPINYFPVIISGNTAAIYPHAGVMTSNQTYYVTMDNGVVADSSGAYFAGISDTNAWKFTTKVGGPSNPTNLVVAADGSGDFVTVQGAADSIPLGNTAYALINIRNGTYTEIVNISGKTNITLRGQSRTGTIVAYGNNANIAPGGTTAARMSFKVNGADIKLENLTLQNTTPQGGSQAEALLVYNSGLRCVVINCDINSRQDTILINAAASQAYLSNCRIVGNFDYVWGTGVGYFDSCTFVTIQNIYTANYNLTAARTATSTSLSATTPWVNPNGTTYSAYGFSFVNCRFEAEGGASNITLAGSNGTAGGLDSWVNCLFDTAAYVTPTTTLSNSYVFWQFNNTNLAGNTAISFANAQTIGVTNNDPRLLAATNVTTWFSGWLPQIAPNILTNPVGTTVNSGDPVTLTVVATGVPSPNYQWLKNGTNVPGATSSVLSIASAQVSDAGAYSVIVSNIAGAVTSTTATVNVNPPVYAPPTITSFGLSGGQFGITFTGDPGGTYGVTTSTNLVDWQIIFTTNAPALPYLWLDPDPVDPERYYRVFVY